MTEFESSRGVSLRVHPEQLPQRSAWFCGLDLWAAAKLWPLRRIAAEHLRNGVDLLLALVLFLSSCAERPQIVISNHFLDLLLGECLRVAVVVPHVRVVALCVVAQHDPMGILIHRFPCTGRKNIFAHACP